MTDLLVQQFQQRQAKLRAAEATAMAPPDEGITARIVNDASGLVVAIAEGVSDPSKCPLFGHHFDSVSSADIGAPA
jgi:hypothetical protein